MLYKRSSERKKKLLLISLLQLLAWVVALKIVSHFIMFKIFMFVGGNGEIINILHWMW